MSEEYVSMIMLAHEWGIDKSNARKYILKHGFDFVRIRGEERTHQQVLALRSADAELMREIRQREGYANQSGDSLRAIDKKAGVLYIVQIIPDVDHLRVKLGYATDVQQRLAAYRTVSPTAELVKTWTCRATWEQAAIDSLTAENCTLINGEVYQCQDIERLVARGNMFFSCMP